MNIYLCEYLDQIRQTRLSRPQPRSRIQDCVFTHWWSLNKPNLSIKILDLQITVVSYKSSLSRLPICAPCWRELHHIYVRVWRRPRNLYARSAHYIDIGPTHRMSSLHTLTTKFTDSYRQLDGLPSLHPCPSCMGIHRRNTLVFADLSTLRRCLPRHIVLACSVRRETCHRTVSNTRESGVF